MEMMLEAVIIIGMEGVADRLSKRAMNPDNLFLAIQFSDLELKDKKFRALVSGTFLRTLDSAVSGGVKS